MTKIICRFDDQASLDEMSMKLKGLSKEVLEYNLDTQEVLKSRKGSPKKGAFTDKHMVRDYFKGFPEYQSKKIDAFHKVIFHTEMDLSEVGEILEQGITEKTKSVWFPKLIQGKRATYRAVGGSSENNYPIYVVSKGRKDNCTTSEYLSRMEVEHYVVVEPFEVQDYKDSLEPKFAKVLEMDLSYKDSYDTFSQIGNLNSTGPGAARNFCWEHSMKSGFKWHWVMDDNANEGFHMLYQNAKIKCRSGAYFKAMEDWVDKFDNIAIAGLNYTKFAMEPSKTPPYSLNTRIYSFLLIRNDIPYRWRGRYNEDTDLSLRVLKDGWCTVQFNSFLAGKITTQKVKGGNTEEFYSSEGTKPKSQMLEDMHPDVAKVVWKFNRWHHHVDYTGYNQKLNPIVDFSKEARVNDLGIKIIDTNEVSTKSTKSELEERYSESLLNYSNPKFNNYEDGGFNLVDDFKSIEFTTYGNQLEDIVKHGGLSVKKLFPSGGGNLSDIICRVPKTNFKPSLVQDVRNDLMEGKKFKLKFSKECYDSVSSYIDSIVGESVFCDMDYEFLKTKVLILILKKISNGV